jgi:Cdc6-like AAA superfamily ATPase
VLYAPRQTGKTTFLINWMRELNTSGKYVACYVSVERCQGIRDIERAIPAIYDAVRQSARMESLPVPEITSACPVSLLSETLEEWAKLVAPKPLIVLFDEVDVLTGEAIISFLRQLRGGFASHGAGNFPVSVALVGVRDLKDYLTQSKDGKELNPGSPFNIKEDFILLKNFSEEDVTKLFAQRTAERRDSESRGKRWIMSGNSRRGNRG